MVLNFSHDTIVGIILSGLGVDVKISPPYAAAIFFELWDDDRGGYYVWTLYNDRPQTFSICYSSNCPFDTFKQVIKQNVAPGAITDACKPKNILLESY